MSELNYEQLEQSLRRAHKRSLGRFLIFLGFVLVLWIATYVVTKGQFSFFTKKIAVTDTLVIDQSSALKSKDSTIDDQQKLIVVLKDSLQRITRKISAPQIPATTPKRIDETIILQNQIANRRREQRMRDSLLEIKLRYYNKEYPNMNQMQQMAK